jgi:tetratricopeptide (TPR) repeat protein
MFDKIPVLFWLVIAIAAAAYAPGRYLYKHLVHAPSRRDITRPPVDLSWRSSAHLARNLFTLLALFGLALFIFTPAAKRFANSPAFWPVLCGAGGVWALSTVARGFASGQIQPLARGFYNIYERQTQPKRFWASIVWNMFSGCALLWFAYDFIDKSPAEIAQEHHRRGELDQANSAYSEAIRLNFDDADSLYNRGLVFEQLANRPRAIEDYSAAIGLRPRDPDAYLHRGQMFFDTDKFDEAVADFTRAHELDPKSPWPLAYRGLAFAWKQDRKRAEKDFETIRKIDPANLIMLHGEAILSEDAGDLNAAVNHLTAVLEQEPHDIGALRTRSQILWQLGDEDKSMADDKKARELESLHAKQQAK